MTLDRISLTSVTIKLNPEHFPAGLSPDDYEVYRTVYPNGNHSDQIVPKGADVCDMCDGAGCDHCDYEGYVYIGAP